MSADHKQHVNKQWELFNPLTELWLSLQFIYQVMTFVFSIMKFVSIRDTTETDQQMIISTDSKSKLVYLFLSFYVIQGCISPSSQTMSCFSLIEKTKQKHTSNPRTSMQELCRTLKSICNFQVKVICEL